MSEETLDVPVLPATRRQLLLAVIIMSIVWAKWVPGGFFDDEAHKMMYCLYPGLLGLVICSVALMMRAFNKDAKSAALYWHIGLWVQVAAFTVFIMTKLFWPSQQ